MQKYRLLLNVRYICTGRRRGSACGLLLGSIPDTRKGLAHIRNSPSPCKGILLRPFLCGCKELGLIVLHQLWTNHLPVPNRSSHTRTYRGDVGLKRVVGAGVVQLVLDGC